MSSSVIVFLGAAIALYYAMDGLYHLHKRRHDESREH
jgi:hypothetical protein